MVTVADIDRWNSEQVREVFHRTQKQIAACDTMVAQFTNLSVFGQWSGQTAEAAKTSVSGTILDFTDHKEERPRQLQTPRRKRPTISTPSSRSLPPSERMPQRSR